MSERNRSEELFCGIEPRGRDYEETLVEDTWSYSFQYTYLGRPYHVRFDREYKLTENLVDAVIDNFQIKLHGSILLPFPVRKDGVA